MDTADMRLLDVLEGTPYSHLAHSLVDVTSLIRTFSEARGRGYDLTLVEAEALEELSSKSVELAPIEARRNLVVRGIALDDLIGRRFRVGEVKYLGHRRCEPCSHLERLTRPGVLRSLVHRGGLRADILSGGSIRTGDLVEALAQSKASQKATVAVVASTLLIAALFNPWRWRIQTLIDRSFYRSRYDAAKTFEGLSMKLRDETDLDSRSEDLVAASLLPIYYGVAGAFPRCIQTPQPERSL